jgi:hypothetical protein
MGPDIAPTRITWHTEGVPEYCTCGATLPEDALFCHKCGKRQRGLDIPEPEQIAPPPPLPPPIPAPQFPAIGFHNGPAVRIALLMGVFSVVLALLLGNLRVPAWSGPGMVVAGFLAVLLYRRRTGQRLTILHGAHLGWISGLFGFAIITVILTVVVLALSDPTFVAAVREQLKATPGQEAEVNQVLDMVRNPSGIFFALLISFVMFTVLPAFGGALGAKFLDRD